MMNVKEFATVKTQGEQRAAAMNNARHWAAAIKTPQEWTTAKDLKNYAGYVRDSLKTARKAHAKIMAAKRAGSARPVSLVMAAILPLMETMAHDAADRTTKYIAEVRAKVAAEGLDVAFPEAARLTTQEQWNRAAVAKRDRQNARRAEAARLTDAAKGADYALKMIEDAVYGARAQFLAYAWKLEAKVGNVTEATLQVLRGVWGESYLYVTTAEGVAQCWKTQTIVNRSVLDNLFYQWPTRTVKM